MKTIQTYVGDKELSWIDSDRGTIGIRMGEKWNDKKSDYRYWATKCTHYFYNDYVRFFPSSKVDQFVEMCNRAHHTQFEDKEFYKVSNWIGKNGQGFPFTSLVIVHTDHYIARAAKMCIRKRLVSLLNRKAVKLTELSGPGVDTFRIDSVKVGKKFTAPDFLREFKNSIFNMNQDELLNGVKLESGWYLKPSEKYKADTKRIDILTYQDRCDVHIAQDTFIIYFDTLIDIFNDLLSRNNLQISMILSL